ncbi:RNA polymerase sigma factor [Dactylosporangium matsuzakiense]|uniref:DNA-directed RNA polymerase sigma-70 factor n=1 Tax=Dactylosporangium matsuzakiense TaxID=53360 RepID=A0A9W6KS39_9ACTN|nr:sigma-70 family RNA polymerase sigma factor [Dactylosporangium matsuzakiense]GLL06135.1 DNA-directed RNA polymerase sigma-70 factor [Dactylosporangium matsuzakiense]
MAPPEADADLVADRFDEVFDRYYGHIYAYAARRLGPDLAEDVASETFLVAYDRRAGFDPARGEVRPWLYGIASNLIMRHSRAEARRLKALARSAEPDAGPDHAELVPGRVDAGGARARLAAALNRLSLGDRDVLLLIAWAGLTQQEAAAALGIPSGTARSRLHRARHEMRKALGTDTEVER